MEYNGEEISEQEWSAADRSEQTIAARIEAGEITCGSCMHYEFGYVCKLLGHRGKPMKPCVWWNKPVIHPAMESSIREEKIDRAIDRITEAHSLAFVEDEWVILRDRKRIKEIIKQLLSSK